MPVLLGWRSSAGDGAQARETLTAWRRLSSFSRSLSDGTRFTRGFLAPSGVLCTRKGQGESWVSPKPPLLSHQAALRGGTSPQLGSCVPPSGCACSTPQLTPATCTPTAPSAPGSCSKRRNSVRPRCPPAHGQRQTPAQPCSVGKDTGAGQSPVGRDRAAAQALAPSVLPEQLLWPFPSGDQKVTRGCRTQKCPPSLPAGVLPAPCQALHGGQRPLTGNSPVSQAPRLTRKQQRRSPWARGR